MIKGADVTELPAVDEETDHPKHSIIIDLYFVMEAYPAE